MILKNNGYGPTIGLTDDEIKEKLLNSDFISNYNIFVELFNENKSFFDITNMTIKKIENFGNKEDIEVYDINRFKDDVFRILEF